MRSIPAPLLAHLQGEVTTLAACWRIERRDGVLILGTEHDRNIVIAGDSPSHPYSGTYLARAGITGSDVRSTGDMSVDNMEVEGAIDTDLQIVDLTAADIESGLFDDASVVLFLVNWQAPDDGQIVLRTGNIGEIRRTAEGQYKTELRGLAQKLSQKFVRTYGSTCDAEFGDSRCGIDLTLVTASGEVTAVTSNRSFTATMDVGSPPAEYTITLYLPMAADIEVGDTFTLRPGCDKTVVMCKERFNNIANFRGHGYLVPGISAITTFGGQTASRQRSELAVVMEMVVRWYAEQAAAQNPDVVLDTSGGLPDEWSSPVSPLYYIGGSVLWITGANAGYTMEVKRAS